MQLSGHYIVTLGNLRQERLQTCGPLSRNKIECRIQENPHGIYANNVNGRLSVKMMIDVLLKNVRFVHL